MNKFLFILTFIVVAISNTLAQPRENYTTTATIVKTSPLATNFIKWEYNSYYLKWEGYLNDMSICTNVKDKKNVTKISSKAQSFDENIQSMRIRKIKYNGNYWYLLSITSYDGAYDYPLIRKQWSFWKETNLYIIYPDQYQKLLHLQKNNNDIIVYDAGSYLTNSKEITLSTTMSTIFRNGKVEHSPQSAHFYIRVENENTIRLLLPTFKGLGATHELDFNQYYFEISKKEFNRVIWFDKETPAPTTIPTPNPQSICDVNNYSTIHNAHFIGGDGAMASYIKSNLVYPTKSYYNHIEGTVIISAEIGWDGSISNIKVKQSVNEELDKEAKRVVTNMPRWKPASKEGSYIRSTVEIPIKFQMSDFAK